MDTDIRSYIRKNFENCTENDIKESILSSVNSEDEVVLPGLGVLFEMTWNNSDEEIKNNIIQAISQALKKA